MPAAHLSQAASPFEPGLSELIFPPASIAIEHRFQSIRAGSCLNASQLEVLERLANWEDRFPAAVRAVGRSLYAHLQPESGWPIAGVKMKGAGGLLEPGPLSPLVCCPPMPARPYRGSEPHFSLNEKLELGVTMGEPRALNSLGLAAAENEYECQQSLAKVDLGMRGLLFGRLVDAETGRQQTDCWGRETGAVFEEADPAFSLMGDFIKFCLADDGDSARVLHSEAKHLEQEPQTAARCITNYLEFMGRAGVVKRRAALEAAVGRHAGHYDNFLYNPARDKLFLADTDSCRLYERLEPRRRGPQLLRDLAGDLLRTIENLSYFAWSNEYLRGLEANAFRPFNSFLQGFFDGLARGSEVAEQADRLQSRYLLKVQLNKERMDWIAAAVREAVSTGYYPVPEIQMKSNWYVTQIPFFNDCLETAYDLLMQSKLPAQGFALPRIPRETLGEQFKRGVNQYLSAIHAPYQYGVPLLR